MAVSARDEAIVKTFVRSMQMGPAGEDAIVDLFAEDGVYVEPLTSGNGIVQTHRGKAAIRRALNQGLKWNPPDFRVSLDRLEIEENELVAYWTCTSAALPGPMTGTDRYTIRAGKIARLETRVQSAG